MSYESVLGLDLSLTSLGMASVDLVDGAIRTRTVKTKLRGAARIDYLASVVGAAAATHDLVGVEGMSYASKGNATLDIAGNWWTIRRELFRLQLPVVVISPATRMKYATGRGARPKDRTTGEWKREVMWHAAKLFPAATLKTDDEADALLIAAIAARVAKVPFDVDPSREYFEPVNALRVERESHWRIR